MTALVQTGLEVFLLLFAHMGKKDCFLIPMNAGWYIKIRDTHVQNAISLMLPDILISRSPRSSVGVDISSVSSTSALRPG